jgi:hypothetical protein
VLALSWRIDDFLGIKTVDKENAEYGISFVLTVLYISQKVYGITISHRF